MAFWGNREKAKQKQIEAGTVDQGERTGVTSGKNMDGFIALVIALVKGNGLAHASIHQERAMLTLPGFFRPTKLWDLLVLDKDRLVAGIELKSQVGPSFGNNFNNRTEEAIGTAEIGLADRHDVPAPYEQTTRVDDKVVRSPGGINDEAINPTKKAFQLLQERVGTKKDPRPALSVFRSRYCDWSR